MTPRDSAIEKLLRMKGHIAKNAEHGAPGSSASTHFCEAEIDAMLTALRQVQR